MRWAIGLCVAAFVTSLVLAQDTSALIAEALDKPIDKLELNGTLPQIIGLIGEKTGVKIVATPSVWDLLPWGQGTNINARIENQTLRQALGAITSKLGLTFVLKENSVELRPMPALQRLGKRATPQELEALELLSKTPLGIDNTRPTFRQLLDAIDQKLLDMKSKNNANAQGYAIENRTSDAVNQDQVVPVAKNATLADALESIASATPATWYPWGKSIVVSSKEDQVRIQLQKSISMRYNGTDISQVLMELSQKAGINFDIQPGSIQAIAPDARNVRIVFDNATVKQALDTISGFTGLSYTVTDRGVYISNTNSGANAGRDPIIGQIPLDNGMQLFVRESQLSPAEREYVRSKGHKWLLNLRQMMKEENFKPTTQPAAPTTEALN